MPTVIINWSTFTRAINWLSISAVRHAIVWVHRKI